MGEPRPDLVIAIDFGMTCTGVAYANLSLGSDTVRWIQKWPGRMQANENKVPTVLVYPNNSLTPSSWGFLSETASEQTAEDKEHREWFKIFLDEERLRQAQKNAKQPEDIPRSIEEVERWYTDYFRYLHQYISAKLQSELASRWEDARIEFIFSVPTTWQSPTTIERFRRITERAGFGQFPAHESSIGLTEAEAAAVHTAREYPAIFRENDILIVCDVGGGTTDLSALRVTNTGTSLLKLEQLDVVFGNTIGSAKLDEGFEDIMLEKLEMANRTSLLGIVPADAAWEMMKSREYQNAKCEFGSNPHDTESYFFAIPKLSRDYKNEALGIAGGNVQFKQEELRTIFDSQIARLFGLVDTQLQRLQQKLPTEQVAHVVLSGGLGNSAYVQQRLRERYASGASTFSNARVLQVRVAPDPQLVVCKGIVVDRVQKLKSGTSVLGWRCCRASYGTICKVVYDEKDPAHFGLRTQKDSMDGRIYIPETIDWFIRQGEPVSADHPIVKNFRRKIPVGNPYRVFPTSVVISHVDKNLLPLTMNAKCQKLCDVQSDLSSVALSSLKLKNRHWWQLGEKYHRVEYCVKVVLGPADVRFELWWNGQKLSKDNPIQVEWHSVPEPAAPSLPLRPSEQAWAPVPQPIKKPFATESVVSLKTYAQ